MASALAGCVVNAAKPYDDAAVGARSDRAIAVVGVTVEGPWRFQRFGVILEQYDVTRQAVTGNCFSYNRLEAAVPIAPGPTRFFAFEVPSGHYIYSAFNGAKFAGNDQAFQVPPGHAVYIGNFVLGDNSTVTLRRGIAQDRAALEHALPKLAAQLEMASAVTVSPAKPFLCAP